MIIRKSIDTHRRIRIAQHDRFHVSVLCGSPRGFGDADGAEGGCDASDGGESYDVAGAERGGEGGSPSGSEGEEGNLGPGVCYGCCCCCSSGMIGGGGKGFLETEAFLKAREEATATDCADYSIGDIGGRIVGVGVLEELSTDFGDDMCIAGGDEGVVEGGDVDRFNNTRLAGRGDDAFTQVLVGVEPGLSCLDDFGGTCCFELGDDAWFGGDGNDDGGRVT